MQDLKARYEKVVADIAECELIGSLAADKEKREMFRDLGEQYRRMAAALKQEIDRRRGLEDAAWPMFALATMRSNRDGVN